MFELQRLASELVGQVMSGRSLDTELQSLWRRHAHLSAQHRAALQDMAYGTLRFLGVVDGVLVKMLERPLKDDRVRHLLRVALYQLVYTRAAPHAVVDHAVRACLALGSQPAKSLVNGVLRNFLRQREPVLAAVKRADTGRYSHPQWWIDKLRAQYPQHYRDMLQHANAHPPLTLRVNRRRSTVEAYMARLTSLGISAHALGGAAVMLQHAVPVSRIPGFLEGDVSVQDAAAQAAASYLDLQPGLRVLDACAAPGGKTAHVLECADVELLALDTDATRLERVQANLTRLCLRAHLIRGDAADPHAWWDSKPYARILADVPCSASGVVRRHPDIKWLRRPDDIARFAERQRAILDALWQLLISDGKLLYVTCSVFFEENNDQIERFLERHHDARRLSLPGPHTDVQRLAGQILPDETHDGFFYALLQKS
ncbi:MAG TPA: 16S rRNA (cytosine(967)-C(5))-methyltransferase RsmB [Burkholderiales bacterium]